MLQPGFKIAQSERFAFVTFPQVLIDLGFYEWTAAQIVTSELMRHASRRAVISLGVQAEALQLFHS